MRRLIWVLWLVLLVPFVLTGVLVGAVLRPQTAVTDSNLLWGHWWRAWNYKPKWGKE